MTLSEFTATLPNTLTATQKILITREVRKLMIDAFFESRSIADYITDGDVYKYKTWDDYAKTIQ